MRRSAEFADTVRRGRRGTTRAVMVHLAAAAGGANPPRAGLVVARSVGPAVVRNRVRRRLRHLLRPRLDALGSGATVVVRAHPPAAAMTSAELARELDRALARAGTSASAAGTPS